MIIFFGIVPVSLTYLLMGGHFGWWLLALAAGIGLMGANVLVVNNYRDIDDDRAVGKRTLAVVLGRRPMLWIYIANGFLAAILTIAPWLAISAAGLIVPCVYLILHCLLSYLLASRSGRALNPLLGMTAMLMMLYAVAFLISSLMA